MKSYLKLTIAVFATVMFISACGNSYKVPEIESLDTYTDEDYQMSIKYPSNWDKVEVKTKTLRSVTFVPNAQTKMLDNYQKYSIESLPGAYIKMTAFQVDSAHPLESKIDKHKQHLANVPTLEIDSSFKLGGYEGVKMSYSFPLNRAEDTMRGFRYIVAADSVTATFVMIETFGSTYEKYKEDLDKILASVDLANTPVIDTTVRDSVVQDTFEFPTTTIETTLSGDGFSIGMPENCMLEKVNTGDGVLSSKHFTAKRHINCGIRIDVISGEVDGNKVTDLKKEVVDKNKDKFGGKNASKTSLSGKTAYKFSYRPEGSNMTRDVFYVMHKNKIYIVFKDIPNVDRDKYKAAMDKALGTLKFK